MAVASTEIMVTRPMTPAARSRPWRSRATTRANISPAQPPTACSARPAASASIDVALTHSSGATV